MSGISWPKINLGSRSFPSQMEIKFDWLEKDLVPMFGGEKIDNAYDLGSNSYRWQRCYNGQSPTAGGSTSAITCYVGSSDMGLYSYTYGNLRLAIKNYDLDYLNIIDTSYDFGQVLFPSPCFMGKNTFRNSSSETTTFMYTSTIYNRGSCFNASTGTFTAPFSGIYEFSFMTERAISVFGGTVASYEITLKTSNRDYKITGLRDIPTGGRYGDLRLTTLADLDKDDTAEMTYYFNDGKSLTVYFCGRFVG